MLMAIAHQEMDFRESSLSFEVSVICSPLRRFLRSLEKDCVISVPCAIQV